MVSSKTESMDQAWSIVILFLHPVKMQDWAVLPAQMLSQLLGFGGGWRGGKGPLNVIHLDLNVPGSRSTREPPFWCEDESSQLREWLRQGSGQEGKSYCWREEQEMDVNSSVPSGKGEQSTSLS